MILQSQLEREIEGIGTERTFSAQSAGFHHRSTVRKSAPYLRDVGSRHTEAAPRGINQNRVGRNPTYFRTPHCGEMIGELRMSPPQFHLTAGDPQHFTCRQIYRGMELMAAWQYLWTKAGVRLERQISLLQDIVKRNNPELFLYFPLCDTLAG